MHTDIATRSAVRFSATRTECPACGASRGFAAVVEGGRVDLLRGFCHACQKGIGLRSSITATRPREREYTHKATTTPPADTKARTERLRRLHEATTAEGVRLRNGLARYLTSKSPAFADALMRYDVGTAHDGRCVYWYRGASGELLTAKSMPYDAATGKRDKSTKYDALFGVFVDGQLQMLRKDDGYAATIYGAHLLPADLTQPVVLVESEKSAVVASVFLSDFIVVASGGATALNAEHAKVLTGRDVYVLYDCDNAGDKGAAAAVDVLRKVGARPHQDVDGVPLSRYLMPDAADGYDVGDYYLDRAYEVARGAAVDVGISGSQVFDKAPTAVREDAHPLQSGSVLLPAVAADGLGAHPSTWSDNDVLTALVRVFGHDVEVEVTELQRRCVAEGLPHGSAVLGTAAPRGMLGCRGGVFGRPYVHYLRKGGAA